MYDSEKVLSESPLGVSSEGDAFDREYGKGYKKGALCDAYNLFHTLVQDFQKLFDAPAIFVVGHLSLGKSPLIEALIRFHLNQVGGGVTTRRPIVL